jgi:uncharacterized iron-regulated protein
LFFQDFLETLAGNEISVNPIKMKRKVFALLFLALLSTAFKKDKPAYRLYDQSGKEVAYSKMVKDLEGAEIIFFGELHDNPIAHWLQYELTSDLYAVRGKDLVLAAEMFETDNQMIINEFMNGAISESSFETEGRLWKNYKTDYKPLLQFAKDSGLVFVASNIPRRYASLVANNGFEGLEELSGSARQFIHPLPIPYDPELKCYKDMLKMEGMGGMHANENLPKAQAVKDATMAYFILKNWQPGKLVIHFNGSYHSDNFQGIVWYIQQNHPELIIRTITTKLQDNLDSVKGEHANAANYILVVPETMTRTY